MFYALSSIGSFTDGARKRQQEIRNERTAIREEFERWKANNPYATAMDFHAKVKQLGATSPGGNVALPDSASIQRMAAENLRRKQEEEAEKERRRRIQDMDMKIKETTYARQLLMDNPNMSASQLLNSMGMPTTGATLEWAEGLQQKMKTELEQAQADRARKLEQEDFRRRQELAGLELKFYEANPAATEADRNAFMAQFGGATPAATSVAAPAAPNSAYGPTVPSKPLAPAKPASSARLQTFIDGQFSGKQGQYLGPDGFEQLKKDVIRTARMGGARSASDAEIIAALEASDFFAEYSKSVDDNAFANQFGGKQPSELSITVGDGKNAMAIELAEIYKSQLNNSNILSSRRIPYDKLDEFQSIVAPYFEVTDGAVQMKPLPPTTSMEQVLAQVEAQLNAAGIYNQDQLAMQRQQKIAEYGQVDSLDILLAKQKGQLDEVVADATKAMKEAGSAAGQQAILNEVAQRFAYFKGLIENDRIADIYANGGVYPLDILPTNQHALYQKDAFYALFDDAMAELNQFAAVNKAQVEDPTETAEANRMAAEEDIVQKNLQAEVTEEEKAAVASFAAGMDAPADPSIIRVVDGQVQRVPFLQDGPVAKVLKSKQGDAFISALRAGLEVYRDDTSGSAPMQAGNILVAAGKSAGRFLSSNAFEGPRQGRAVRVFKEALRRLEVSNDQLDTLGLRAEFERYKKQQGSDERVEVTIVDFLADLFQSEILNNPTEYETGETQSLFGGPATVPVTKLAVDMLSDILLAPPAPKLMTQEQMLQQSVPGARFVIPN
jgi:hypothetical protein